MVLDKSKGKNNTLYFEPSWQEGDHHVFSPHYTSILNLASGVVEINIPKGADSVLVQAVDQNVNYTLSGTDPSATSGFVLIAGNDPITIPARVQKVILKVHAATDGARLELQFGRVLS